MVRISLMIRSNWTRSITGGNEDNDLIGELITPLLHEAYRDCISQMSCLNVVILYQN